MSVFASPSKTTVDMDEINKVLWPVYVRAALRGATISRCEVVGTVQKREWLKLLRGGGLDGAQATLVYYGDGEAREALLHRALAGFRVMRSTLERTVPRATNAGHGTCAGSAGGEARWAGGAP
ncbi:hypothetical protein JL722_15027 [Aureococcus anophagefferens]|nr:hypothetical protein JL722_15027 [Aureococcus anophagefferens]